MQVKEDAHSLCSRVIHSLFRTAVLGEGPSFGGDVGQVCGKEDFSYIRSKTGTGLLKVGGCVYNSGGHQKTSFYFHCQVKEGRNCPGRGILQLSTSEFVVTRKHTCGDIELKIPEMKSIKNEPSSESF